MRVQQVSTAFSAYRYSAVRYAAGEGNFRGGRSRFAKSIYRSKPNPMMAAHDRFESEQAMLTRASPISRFAHRGGGSSMERSRTTLLLDSAKRADNFLERLTPDHRTSLLNAAMRDPEVRAELDGVLSVRSRKSYDRMAASVEDYGVAFGESVAGVLDERELENLEAAAHGNHEQAAQKISNFVERRRETDRLRFQRQFREVVKVSNASQSIQSSRREESTMDGFPLDSAAGKLALDKAKEAVRAAGYPTKPLRWGPTSTRFDKNHAASGEDWNSEHSLRGRRYSWRPNFDLHEERYNWRPLEDRVFRELPTAPRVARNYIPPLEGDEHMESNQEELIDTEAEDPYHEMLKEATGTGKDVKPFPVIKPKERFYVRDGLGRAVGRGGRKEAYATAWVKERNLLTESASVYEDEMTSASPMFRVNGRPLTQYFKDWLTRDTCLQPLSILERHGYYNVECEVHGGGIVSQSEAVRMAVSQALCSSDPGFRPALKAAEFLRRDPRMVLPKVSGRKKARKMKQWRKR